jgi:glycosyltransferase involved in cell wall biosynthesis
MPVFNEAKTVAAAIDRVLDVRIDGVTIDLVIVESKSTDGSRGIVMSYSDVSGVQVVLQDDARGKGYAVRAGFEHARGEIILIQDADLEYSVDDYPALIEPIVDGQVDFTLGCRHVRGKPMRIMEDDRLRAWIVNGAHWVFLALFDLTYGTRLRDPFTMYKVFRRECIDGIEFVSDRFDFDWELVATLIRLGYEPLEVPVTYNARDFGEGKKVRFFRDPPTWVWACLRFRFRKLERRSVRITDLRAAPPRSSLPARAAPAGGGAAGAPGTRPSSAG